MQDSHKDSKVHEIGADWRISQKNARSVCCCQIRLCNAFPFSFPCCHLISSVRSSRLPFCAHISEDINEFGRQLVVDVVEQMLKTHLYDN